MSAPRALALPNVDHCDTETTAAHLSSISTPSPSLKADYGVGLHRQTRQQRHCDPEYSDNDDDDLSDGDTDSSCSGDDDNDEVVQYHKQRHRGRQRERTDDEQQHYDDNDDAVLAETTAVVGGDSADLESSSLFTAAAAINMDDPTKIVTVVASDGKSGDQREIAYTNCKVIGNGSFGVVFSAKLLKGYSSSDGQEEQVAIKKVLQDKRFKNRELQIMRMVSHPNVVNLHAFFYSNGEKAKKDEVYLNLVLEFVPETVYRASRQYAKLKQTMPMSYIKLYMYQLLRSLAYIHCLGICHRDIKPQNLLLNPHTGILKLCDFGSAKILVAGEPNVSYICSRYYRAPELIFGATNYTTNIDVWSTGCVMAELMLGQPLFPGESGIDQLVEIIKVLGTPTREQIKTMNPNYMEHKFPQIKPHPFNKVFRPRTAPDAISLISKLLEYTPSARLTAIEAMCHPLFDELKVPDAKMQSGKDLPALFDFTREELSIRPDLMSKLVPQHAEEPLLARGIDIRNFTPIPAEDMRITLD